MVDHHDKNDKDIEKIIINPGIKILDDESFKGF